MEKFLKFGILDGKLKHISEVENGLSCNCNCPECGHPLVAKNNLENKKIAHFAHYSGTECDGAIETALHMLAKSILLEQKMLLLPDYHYDYNSKNQESKFRDGKLIAFEDILIEENILAGLERIRPDAIGIIGEKQVLIEFANTHFIDTHKKEMIKSGGFACIEIDLTGQVQDKETLSSFLKSHTTNIYWIINPKYNLEYQDYIEKKKADKKIEEALAAKKKREELYESNEKYKNYKNNPNYKIVKFREDDYSACPLVKIEISKYKNEKFYKHPILKQIIDGSYWNKKLYGYAPNEKYIFFDNCKVCVLPSFEEHDNLSSDLQWQHKQFYIGLKEIQSISNSYKKCDECQYFVEELYINKEDFYICKYPNK